MFCSQCGTRRSPTGRFCEECGAEQERAPVQNEQGREPLMRGRGLLPSRTDAPLRDGHMLPRRLLHGSAVLFALGALYLLGSEPGTPIWWTVLHRPAGAAIALVFTAFVLVNASQALAWRGAGTHHTTHVR